MYMYVHCSIHTLHAIIIVKKCHRLVWLSGRSPSRCRLAAATAAAAAAAVLLLHTHDQVAGGLGYVVGRVDDEPRLEGQVSVGRHSALALQLLCR